MLTGACTHDLSRLAGQAVNLRRLKGASLLENFPLRRRQGGTDLRSMKEGALVVNAARGGLIDEQALLACLQDGHLAGAALDCFEQEPYIGPLAQLENVVLTGHIGSYAKEGRAIMEKQAAENLVQELMNISTAGVDA